MARNGLDDFDARQFPAAQVEAETRRFLLRVYGWMSAGLVVTAATALGVGSSAELMQILLGSSWLFMALLFVELIMVWTFSSRARNVSSTVAAAMFMSYALLNGITCSVIFLIYTRSSIALTFGVAAGMFAGMSAFGALTKRSLDGWADFLFMGLWGVFLTSLANLFFHSSAMSWVVSCCGVVVFTGLTAYDTQKIKQINIIGNEGTEEDTSEAINGALILYLDFVNLFLNLLRLMGGRK